MDNKQEQIPFAFASDDPLTDIINQNIGQFSADFLAWLSLNKGIWNRFEVEANKLWNHGVRRWGARTIIEYLRHETALFDTDRTFKLNNNNAPDMARLYTLRYPDRAGFFEKRVMPGSNRSS